MNQNTRNTLRNVVTQCRRLLEESVAQVLQGQFGIYAAGKKDEVQIDPEARMSHLSDEDRAYRQDLLDHYEHIKALGYKAKEALAQLIREVAFTHLNRFCAYRMMESRGLIRESVSKGLKSQGFLFYLADHEEDERRFNTGQQDVAYRHFLNWLGGTLSEEIGVLFAPTDPANRLYPPQRVIDQVLGLLNDPELAGIWSEDEAIGWVYQYFTPKELREAARKESKSPRNSYELAFRNQFFTPRYVVEFLTDNTLGRIWYEMRQGNTRLKDQCRYMVRRPTEVFLKDGEAEPTDAATVTDDFSQEELLRLPVYIPFRAKKDPREIRILDPACGSGHFLLYCFDLLLTIYEEAYGDPDLGPALKKDYPTLEDLRRDVPRLILAHNLHGIDIDLRASQIAALALWLRCQRAYQDADVKQDRPKITRAHIVCAEPMPGDSSLRADFIANLSPRLLGQLTQSIFTAMEAAGDLGSLLDLTSELTKAVTEAQKAYEAAPVAVQRSLFEPSLASSSPRRFDFSGVTDNAFFAQAEKHVVDSLRQFGDTGKGSTRLDKRLFVDDAVRGFGFVEACHMRFDVVLMNPPFGLPVSSSTKYIRENYDGFHNDILAAFVARGHRWLNTGGMLGAITSRTCLVKRRLESLRRNLLIPQLSLLLDLGKGIMDDAMVESAAYVLTAANSASLPLAFDFRSPDKTHVSAADVLASRFFVVSRTALLSLPLARALYAIPLSVHAILVNSLRCEPHVWTAREGMKSFDNERFLRLKWEPPPSSIGNEQRWQFYVRGEGSTALRADIHLLLDWDDDGRDLKAVNRSLNGSTSQVCQASAYWKQAGCTYTRRSKTFAARTLPPGCIFSDMGPAILPTGPWTPHALLAYANSSLSRAIIHLQAHASDYQTGILKNLPLPNNAQAIAGSLTRLGDELIRLATHTASWDETDCCFDFVRPPNVASLLIQWDAEHKAFESEHAKCQAEIDGTVLRAFGLSEMPTLETAAEAEEDDACGDDLTSTPPTTDARCPARFILSYAMGCVFGRWDIRRALAERERAAGGDILPAAISPASLVDDYGLACSRSPDNYLLAASWDGLLVDDPSHDGDVVCLLRAALAVMWPRTHDVIESELLSVLGLNDLRSFIRKAPKAGLWEHHLSQYTKSHRSAPIYWLLQSSKKNYAIWLYYHRLDKDILFKALVNYVEPKIRLEDDRLDSLRAQKGEGGTGKATKKLDKEIEKQEEFLSELRDFEQKMRRAAELHIVPDLNDGVVLNIAPLHELVPWKEAEKYWEELIEGKYEWSSIGKQLREKGLVK
jgi:hypothetical protein